MTKHDREKKARMLRTIAGHDREKKARMLRTIAGLLENGVDPCDEFQIRLNIEGQDRKFFRPRSLYDLLCSIELMHYDVRLRAEAEAEGERE